MSSPTERESKGQLQKPPEGTYRFLRDIFDAHKSDDPRFQHFQVQFTTDKTIVTIDKEVVCEETGGSCMDLSVYEDLGHYNGVIYHAHITDNNALAVLEANPNSTALDRGIKIPVPNIRRVLKLTRKVVESQDFTNPE